MTNKPTLGHKVADFSQKVAKLHERNAENG